MTTHPCIPLPSYVLRYAPGGEMVCRHYVGPRACSQGPNPDDDVEEVTIVTGGAQKGKEPSRCVWAILSCCAPANTPVRYSCFDVLGCSTAFWDTNPCVPAILRAALEQATLYYGPVTSNKNGTETPATTPPSAAPPATTAAASTVDLTGTATTAAPTA